MYKIGDHVEFAADGTKGTVVGVNEEMCQVIWEDHFVSWEHPDKLKKREMT